MTVALLLASAPAPSLQAGAVIVRADRHLFFEAALVVDGLGTPQSLRWDNTGSGHWEPHGFGGSTVSPYGGTGASAFQKSDAGPLLFSFENAEAFAAAGINSHEPPTTVSAYAEAEAVYDVTFRLDRAHRVAPGASFDGLLISDTDLLKAGEYRLAASARAFVIAFDVHDEMSDEPSGKRLELIPFRRNLVLITHGWQTLLKPLPDLSDAFPNTMQDAYARRLEEAQLGSVDKKDWTPDHMPIWERLPNDDCSEVWDVVALDWTVEAHTFLPRTAAANGQVIGKRIGNRLKDLNYDAVHFVGHSAGSWLIDAAADVLRGHTPQTGRPIDIHLTFLDAFTPGFKWSELGESADFAEHYFDRTFLPFTATPLHNAYNLAVDRLVESGEQTGHGWPVTLYESGIINEPRLKDWGFSSSRASKRPDGWRAEFGPAVGPGKGIDLKDETPLRDTLIANLIRTLFFIDHNVATPSAPDVISEAGNHGFVFTATSPAEGRQGPQLFSVSVLAVPAAHGPLASYEIPVTFPESADFIEFDYKFLSTSEGVLSVFLDGELLFIAEELSATGDESSRPIWFESPLAGNHVVRFELLPRIGVDCRVMISNLTWGQAFEILGPEPNRAPVLTIPADQSISELESMAVMATASDPEIPANALTFSLIDPPEGATVNPATGLITWRPTRGQAGTAILQVRVTDDGTPPLSDTKSFKVTVAAASGPIANPDKVYRKPRAGFSRRLAGFLGNDRDRADASLTIISVNSSTAAGGKAWINADLIFYSPPVNDPAFDSFAYTIQNGSGLTATGMVGIIKQVQDTVNTAKVRLIRGTIPGSVILQVKGSRNQRYSVEATTDVTSGVWNVIRVVSTGDDGTTQFTDTLTSGSSLRLFRVTDPLP